MQYGYMDIANILKFILLQKKLNIIIDDFNVIDITDYFISILAITNNQLRLYPVYLCSCQMGLQLW